MENLEARSLMASDVSVDLPYDIFGTSGSDGIWIMAKPDGSADCYLNGKFTRSYSAEEATLTIYAGGGNDLVVVVGSPTAEIVVHGGAGDDRIITFTQPVRAYGEEGNDVLRGGDGNDHIIGGEGNDLITGASGDDWLSGGGGTDRIFGGDGHDVFRESSVCPPEEDHVEECESVFGDLRSCLDESQSADDGSLNVMPPVVNQEDGTNILQLLSYKQSSANPGFLGSHEDLLSDQELHGDTETETSAHELFFGELELSAVVPLW